MPEYRVQVGPHQYGELGRRLKRIGGHGIVGDLEALGVDLKVLSSAGLGGAAAGLGPGRTLRAQLLSGIRAGVKPAIEDVKRAARDNLPASGGLNEYVANEKITVQSRTSGRTVGVRVKPKSGRAWGANQATVRHPVFGNRKRWAVQPLAKPGWFTETLEKRRPAMTAAVRASMEAVAIEATRRLTEGRRR